MKKSVKKNKEIFAFFRSVFGVTSIEKRINDIARGAKRYHRYGTFEDKKQAICDIYTSAIVMLQESGISHKEAISTTRRYITKNIKWYKKHGRRIRVALDGISGDMTHLGHLQRWEYILNNGYADFVYVFLAFENMTGKKYEDLKIRIKILLLTIKHNNRIKFFPIETDNEFSGETHHTINHMLTDPKYKGKYEFILTYGSDVGEKMPFWINSKYLITQLPMIFFSRKGSIISDKLNWIFESDDIRFVKVPEKSEREISSSEIKRLLLSDHPDQAKSMLNNEAYDFIIKKGAYGTGK